MRRRMIDPAFWTDAKITAISFESRLLYIGLWQYADDEGLFVEDLKNIKMVLFPDQKFPLEKSYQELSMAGFFRFGSAEGARVVEIRHFGDWQSVNRPTPSKLRDFVTFTDDSLNTHEDSVKTHSQVKLREVKYVSVIEKLVHRINELSGKAYCADSKASSKYLHARLAAGCHLKPIA